MEVSLIDIHELLPQQEPFVMVGCLLHFDMVETVTQTVVNADNIFVEEGKFTSSGIIENIAQTCAARIGYINKYILKKGIQIGFIGAVRKLQIFRLPDIGETIVTKIHVFEEVFGMILAEAEVKTGSETIAKSEIKIALSEKEV
ncbi:MAG: pseudouridylate synthase [Muribaculaceae bacterium]|nr:pseudouridylate synthase [Muribaculaceae bacterium]